MTGKVCGRWVCCEPTVSYVLPRCRLLLSWTAYSWAASAMVWFLGTAACWIPGAGRCWHLTCSLWNANGLWIQKLLLLPDLLGMKTPWEGSGDIITALHLLQWMSFICHGWMIWSELLYQHTGHSVYFKKDLVIFVVCNAWCIYYLLTSYLPTCLINKICAI